MSQSGRGPAWQGRTLKLHHPPDAEHAPAHAQVFVDTVREVDMIDLDYSIDSLKFLDAFGDDLGREVGSDEMAETFFTAGCYLGEVLVRNLDCRWVDFDEKARNVLGMPFGVQAPGGALWNPIGKVFKLVDNGLEDSVSYFASVVAAQNNS